MAQALVTLHGCRFTTFAMNLVGLDSDSSPVTPLFTVRAQQYVLLSIWGWG